MHKPLAVSALIALAAVAVSAQVQLHHVEPFRLKVQPAGRVEVVISGSFNPGFTSGHPDIAEYEHVSVLRAEAGQTWHECTIQPSSPCAIVRSGFLGKEESLTLSLSAADFASRPGLIDIKVAEGLRGGGSMPGPDSNVLRVPVVAAFGPAPKITSLSKTTLPVDASDEASTLRIVGSGYDPNRVTVLIANGRVDYSDYEVVHPAYASADVIDFRIPKRLRSGEGDVIVNILDPVGGNATPQHVRFYASKPAVVSRNAGATLRNVVIAPPANAATTTAVSPGVVTKISPDVVLANRVRTAISERLGAEIEKTLTITASNGHVTLRGTGDAALRDRIAAVARNVSGVVDVSWK